MRLPSAAKISAFAQSASDALDLPLPETYRPGVEANLSVAFRLSAHFLDSDLGDEAEPAPVFHAMSGSSRQEQP